VDLHPSRRERVAWTGHGLPQLLVASASRNANAALHRFNKVLPVLWILKTNKHRKILEIQQQKKGVDSFHQQILDLLYQKDIEIQQKSGFKESEINLCMGLICCSSPVCLNVIRCMAEHGWTYNT